MIFLADFELDKYFLPNINKIILSNLYTPDVNIITYRRYNPVFKKKYNAA